MNVKRTKQTKKMPLSPAIRSLVKGTFMFQEMLITRAAFANDLVELLDKWNSGWRKRLRQGSDSMGYAVYCKTPNEKRLKMAIAQKKKERFFQESNKASLGHFSEDVVSFTKKYDLGREWISSIADVVLSLWLMPPTSNLHISKDERKEGHQRVILELNPDTSLQDIKDAWGLIEKRQKKLFPGFPKRNLTKKWKENLEIAKKALNHTGTDLELVTMIWDELPGEEITLADVDRGRAVKLRQLRNRLKKKRDSL